ncbi:peptidyl-prolyl cis-trans isomerase cyclophilin-type [Babesia bovis T2Bo]|uniref:Peptidyl-prolyl cis-trans isomerase, cyclophilin-type n=1 Tax=Babesia bovis TaxID=5865 RepID=A7AWV2_BABBO|nr:peptidyl-prolyl cis-trans isomerase cyclophilin-type [Babesia bovis T2Bo]EDO05530.1 peptidyl-prolyl cis-trans isomerase cyclophilin-type [Babesia bovis T2Bo]|eukprot:XP_001609098.1 peptidyl-prolyl cis-trans isomerase, cyclophilin-type [Babesia bovis T2Bo]
MRSTLLLPLDVLHFLARKINTLSWRKKLMLGALCGAAYYSGSPKDYGHKDATPTEDGVITDYVYFDFAADRRYLGRVLVGLYGRHQPLTCENIVQLCKGYQLGEQTIGYRNSRISQIYPGNGIVLGDLFHGDDPLKSCTIYGRTMPEESFEAPFVQEGDIAMLTSRDQSGLTSRFLITLTGNPLLGRHPVVVGTVVKGMKLIRSLGKEIIKDGKPVRDIRIINCGLYSGPEDGPKSYYVLDT